ncbi:MAG TPA: glycosyltransferase [Chthoniobacteraceae bacterium]|nr:glycosyltransferase [Chthoniobacteraceae bacterium]
MPALKLVFLCGCAEPGRDGVGDYTALLAAECGRRGSEVLRIALRDPYVTGPRQTAGLLRLPAGSGWEPAREAVRRFDPDVVSLQWVPYAFHARGMPLGISGPLARLLDGRKAHLMCHETWVGANVGAGVKHRLAGAVQRASLRAIVKKLKPLCIHTSNDAYAALLTREGMAAELLPLFGSIPIAGVRAGRAEGPLRFGMFGELHDVWPPEPLLSRLLEAGRPIRIEHIGKIGRGGLLWKRMTKRDGITFQRHGEQPAERISQFLMDMDFGIATTPLALIGKSGTAAAMLEHGLPVIVNRDDVHYPGIHPGAAPQGVIVMDDLFPQALREAKPRPPHSRVAEIADQFLRRIGRDVR